MQYLVYVSAAVKLLGDEELREILAKSRFNNERDKITGMLLYSEGAFIQVLEGPIAAVEAIFSKIEQDKRHRGVIKLASGGINERAFADWSMAFKTATTTEFSKFSSFADIDGLNLANNDIHPAVSMLKAFLDTNTISQ